MPLREWTRRLGALPAEAHDCFMVRTPGFNRIQAWFAIDRGKWQAPLGFSRGQPPDRRQRAAVLASVKDEAFGGAKEAPSLNAAASDGD